MSLSAFLRHNLEFPRQLATLLLTDLQDAPYARPHDEGGNHAHWILTHLVYAEGTLFDTFIHGRPNRFADWEPIAGMGTTPHPTGEGYPPYEQLLADWQSIRDDVLEYVDGLSEDGLMAASHAPEQYDESFGTIGKCLSAIATHPAMHSGQATVIRAALGRPRLLG